MRNIKYTLAALVLGLGLSACGDDDTSAPDAGDGVDGAVGIDAATPDASTANACGALVFDSYTEEPLVGATAVFSAPDGSYLGSDAVDFSGGAMFNNCVADTTISVLFDDGGILTAEPGRFYPMTSVFGVQPGQTIRVTTPLFRRPKPVAPVTTLVINPDPPPSASTYICASAGARCPSSYVCGDREYCAAGDCPTEQLNLSVYEQCLNEDGTVDVLFWASDFESNSGPVDAWGWQLGITPIANQETTPVAGPKNWSTANLAVLGFEVLLGAAPTFAFYLDAGLGDRRHGQRYFDDVFQSGSVPLPDPPPLPLPVLGEGVPAGFSEVLVSWVSLYFDSKGGPGGTSQLCRGTTPGVDPADVAISTDLMPRVGFLVQAGDPANPQVVWSADGALTGADLGAAQTFFTTDGLFGSTSDHVWVAIFPGTQTSPLSFPDLPDQFAAYGPDATAIFHETYGAFYELSWLDYAAMVTQGQPIRGGELTEGELPCDDVPLNGLARSTTNLTKI